MHRLGFGKIGIQPTRPLARQVRSSGREGDELWGELHLYEVSLASEAALYIDVQLHLASRCKHVSSWNFLSCTSYQCLVFCAKLCDDTLFFLTPFEQKLQTSYQNETVGEISKELKRSKVHEVKPERLPRFQRAHALTLKFTVWSSKGQFAS